MISLKQILSEQTAYTRFLDKQYSTPEGAKAYNAAQRAFIKQLFTSPQFYEVAGMITSLAIKDPRIRIPTTVALELNAARLYYEKGDYVNAAITGVFAGLPMIGEIPGIKRLTKTAVDKITVAISTGTKLTTQQLKTLANIVKNKPLIQSRIKKFNDFLDVVKQLPKSKNLQRHLDDLILGKINRQQFFDAFKGYHTGMTVSKLTKELPLQHGSPKMLNVDDLVLKDAIPVDKLMRPGKSSKKAALGPDYGPGGLYTTHRSMPGFYGPGKGGSRKYFYSFEIKPGSVVLDARNANFTMDFINVGSLQQYADDGFDAIIGKGTVGGYEILPLNKNAITNWRLQK